MNFTPILKHIFLNRAKQCAKFAEQGETIQRNQLQYLLKRASNTCVGELYNFDSIKNYEQYQRKVPLVEYDNIRDDIMDMINGAHNILWPGEIKNFAKSSGTTGSKSKYIPISNEGLQKCHYNGGFDSVAMYLNCYPNSRLFSGKAFILGGSFDKNNSDIPATINCGDLSATLINRINPLVNLLRVPDKQTALLPDWEQKLELIVKNTMHEDVTNLSGVPSWFLVVLKRILHESGCTSLHELWPNLEVFFHGGISFEPYRTQYSQICDMSKMHFFETYNASEGFFATQDRADSNAMLLLLDNGVFYEFIPFEESDKPDAKAIPLWEVEVGKIYELVITTNSGLWRYRIGDTVSIESVAPVRIRIAGRTKHFINAFGEELMVHNADNAIYKTCAELNASILNYTAAPVYSDEGQRGHHQWLIEFDKEPESLEIFADTLDKNLQNENSDYEAKRYKGIFLDRLEIVKAKTGLFHLWHKGRGKMGGQQKVPRLFNGRDIIEKMLELNNYQQID